VAPTNGRCGSCGMAMAGRDGRPGPYSRATWWWTAAGGMLVYLVALVIVALAR
jgi:hypothetical protein